MPRALVRDIETRSVLDLDDVGVHIYATHPSTEVLCVGYAVDDDEPKIWHPGEPVPKVFHTAANGGKWDWVAHFAAFEIGIERAILGPKFGFPIAPIEQQVCTMALCHALALPGGLARAAKVLKLENQKDTTGGRLMRQLAMPRRPRKGEDKNGVYFYNDPERLARNDEYCLGDVKVAREIYQSLPPLLPEEQETWILDLDINDYGFHLDRELAEAAREIVAAAHPAINAELTDVTNGEVTAFTQVARLTNWLKQYIEVKTLKKGSLDELLDQELPENVRRAIELRMLGAQAAVAKVDALLQRRCEDGRVRGAFVYHAAGTGRWSSRGAQVHNLKRPLTKDLMKAIEIVSTGDLSVARQHYDNPLSIIGDCIRPMIIAKPGHVLMGGDFSGIEARVTAWIAGEERKLDVFRAYDRGEGPDPYIIFAAKAFGVDPEELAARWAAHDAGKVEDPEAREMRQGGKAGELAFGFQGGVRAYLRFAPDTELSVQEIERIKNMWRRTHPNIAKFWDTLDTAAKRAAKNPGSVVSIGNNLQITVDDAPFMYITLPSGRQIGYPQARMTRGYVIEGRIIEHERGWSMLLFKDAAQGQWQDVKVYGGLLTENIVQGIARDLLRDAMRRVAKAGFRIVTHTHDECVVEVPIAQAEKLKPKFIKLMAEAPEWAQGLPIVVKGWISPRYVK